MSSRHLHDDRGTPRPIVPFESKLPGHMDEDKRRRLAADSWRDSLSPTWDERKRATPWYLALAPGILALVLFPGVDQFLRQRVPGPLLLLLFSLFLVLYIWWFVYVMLWARTRKHVLLYLHAGYCGSCGQDLRGLTPQTDGCTVCAECGAAWRLNRPA